MPVTVKVNGAVNSVVHKGSNGISMATIPDVCKTPSPAGPVPIPYPNISQSAMLAKGTTTVKADGGMMIANKGSEFSMSNGDNAGVAGGVKSSTFMKESTWLLYSFDVKLDGKNACRFTDKKFQNHENTVDMGGVLQPPVVQVPADVDANIKPAILEAEILEVHWLAGLDVARDKTKVVAPHWKAGEAAEEDDDPVKKQRWKSGSKKPGAYDLASTAKGAKLKVKINITRSEEQPGQGTLRGQLGELAFEASCPTGAGTHEVELPVKGMPDTAKHFEGDVGWTLETTATVCSPKNTTRLEMFVVLKKPAAYYTTGVWAEALRFVFKKGSLANVKKDGEAASAVSRLCHTTHGMTYDTVSGGSQFGAGTTGTGSFRLMKYMAKEGNKNNVVNCYDQAAAIQSLCGALGVVLDWIYLSPYGFIKPTNLVGVGLCNNPFYMGNGSKKLMDWDDPKRTGFGNHAFARLGTGILDACAGPHTGFETLREYMESAIDGKRTRIDYKAPPKWTDEDYWKYLEAKPNPHAGVTGVV
jgi:Domain of unknown function (DUF4150)